MKNTIRPQTINQCKAAEFMIALGEYDKDVLKRMSKGSSKFWQMGYDLPLSGSHQLWQIVESLESTYQHLPNGIKFQFLTFTEEANKVTIEAESIGLLVSGETYTNQHHAAVYFDEEGFVEEYRDYLDTLYLYETLFDGHVKPKTCVAKKDRLLRPVTIPKIFKYLPFKHFFQEKNKLKDALKKCHTEEEENKIRALTFISAIGHQDLLTLATLYALKGTFWQIGKKLVLSGEHSQVETANFVPRIYQRLPSGMSFENTSIVSSERRVAVESVSNAILHNGKTYKNQYNFMFYFDDAGKVIQFKEYWGTHHAYSMLLEGQTDFL